MPEETKRNLSAELRPKRLSELIGQDTLVNELRELGKRRIPVMFMFVGEPGVGKSTVAKVLANAVQCSHGVFGEPCDECLENSCMFNIIERNCADLGTKADMQELLRGLNVFASYGKYRVVILDEAHGMGQRAQETLLIPTENTDLPTVFILCTTDPGKILDTIKRRSMIFTVQPITEEFVQPLVEQTIIRAEGSLTKPAEPLVKALLSAKQTAPGLIVSAVDYYLIGRPPEQAINVMSGSNMDVESLIRACKDGNWTLCQKLLGNAVPSDVNGLRSRLAGYFRKVMLSPNSSQLRVDTCVKAIQELAEYNAPSVVYETGFQLSLMTASIRRICSIIQETAAQHRLKAA